MKVLLCGAGGQLGRAVQSHVPGGTTLVALGRSQLDICDPDAVREAVAGLRPAAVINAAAYTNVEAAERERDLAFRANAEAPGTLARCCESIGARLIHVSTDYVFDGRSGKPYRPGDATNPLNVYGASKLEGEKRVLGETGGRGLVLRTAWVYAAGGNNFIMKVLERMRSGNDLRVVRDQIGTPTWAVSLAQAIWSLLRRDDAQGILHYTDAGRVSWYDVAIATMEAALSLKLIPAAVGIEAIGSSEFPAAAQRPAFSVLDISATEALIGRARPWRESLRLMLEEVRAA